MRILAVISTKGGVGKTTIAASLGGFLADAGHRVLMIDLDVQPTLSSFYAIARRAPCGIYELLTRNEIRLPQIASRTVIPNLDLIISNDALGQLNTLLLHAPDGRLRLRNLITAFEPHYDVLIIDTQGARTVLLETAILAANVALSPITPEILAAREFSRGTLQLLQDMAPFRHLGITAPPLHLLINRTHPVAANGRIIQQALRQIFQQHELVKVLGTTVPAIECYPRAATLGLPVHRVERRRPTHRLSPSALETMNLLATELFPQWHPSFAAVDGGPTEPGVAKRAT